MDCSRPQSWLRAEGRTPRLSKGREGKLLTMAQKTSELRAPSEVVYYNPIVPTSRGGQCESSQGGGWSRF